MGGTCTRVHHACGCHPSYFSRTFVYRMGDTVHQKFTDFREAAPRIRAAICEAVTAFRDETMGKEGWTLRFASVANGSYSDATDVSFRQPKVLITNSVKGCSDSLRRTTRPLVLEVIFRVF